MSQQPRRRVKRNPYMVGTRPSRVEMDPGRISSSMYGDDGVELVDLAESEAREALRSRQVFYYAAVVLALVSALVRQPLLFVAALLVVALTVIPEIWYRFGLRQLAVRRAPATTRAVFGDSTEISLLIENRKLLPLPYLEVEDDFPDALPVEGMRLGPSSRSERATLSNTLSLWAYERVRRRYRVHAVARGAYKFGPMKLRAGDPFGILTREATIDVNATLLVHPLVAPIERFGLASKAPFGERKAARRLLEDPLRVSGIRDYQPGDEPRRIHWKATARTGTLQSKIYEPSTRHTIAVFVEVRTYNRSLMGYDPQLVELAIAATASVATWALEQRYAVGVYSNGTISTTVLNDGLPADRNTVPQSERNSSGEGAPSDGGHDAEPPRTSELMARIGSSLRLRVPPSARPEQEVKILDGLARLLPYYGLPMHELIASEQHRLPFGATIVYVGAEAAVDVPLILALRRLREKGHAVSLLLTRADSTDPADLAQPAPSDGLMHLADLPVHYLGGRELWRELEADVLGYAAERKASSYTWQSGADPDAETPPGKGDTNAAAAPETTGMVWSAEAARLKGLAAWNKPESPPRTTPDAASQTKGVSDSIADRGTVERATGGAGQSTGSGGAGDTGKRRDGWRKARSLVVE